MLNNQAESNLTVLPSFFDSDIVLSNLNTNFIQNVVEQSIPEDIWQSFKTVATENGFMMCDIGTEKKKISKHMTNAVTDCWDHARDLERQGYKVTGFMLQLHFTSHVAQTEMNCDILTTETERKYGIVLKDMLDDEPEILNTNTIYQPEDIPWVINAVRTGAIPTNLPRIAVARIKEELEKDPDWNGDNLDEMMTSVSELELYKIKIKPALFFESPQPQAQIEVSSSDTSIILDANAINSMDSIDSQQATSIQNVRPVIKKEIYFERTISSGLINHSIFTKYKPTPYTPCADELGLDSLSL